MRGKILGAILFSPRLVPDRRWDVARFRCWIPIRPPRKDVGKSVSAIVDVMHDGATVALVS
jgi:hypothetical protein